MNEQLDLLDILTIISFTIQLQNQSNIIRMTDVQKEVRAAVNELHEHLEVQDDKLDQVLTLLKEKEYKYDNGSVCWERTQRC